MKEMDYVVVATARGGQVAAYAATTRGLVEEMRRRHDTWPVVTAALGRVATVGAILTSTLKEERHQITLQVNGDGPAGRILVVATGTGDIRGYADEPHVHLPLNERNKLDVSGAVGKNGSLYVIKDLGLKEPYRGMVPITSGEIGEDFTYYFAVSEQTPSAVAVGVLVDVDLSVLAAGGILIHILPGAHDQDIAELEQILSDLPAVSSLLRDGLTPEDILYRVFPRDLRILERKEVRFQCNCGKDRLGRVLISLGKQELENLIEEQGHAELVCHFCSEKYYFSGDELKDLRDHALS